MPTTYQPTPTTKRSHEASSAKRLKTLAAKPIIPPVPQRVELDLDSSLLPWDEIFCLRIPGAAERWEIIRRRVARG